MLTEFSGERTLRSGLFVSVALALVIGPVLALAASPHASPPPAAADAAAPVMHDSFAPPDAVTQHTMLLNGQTLAYTARAGTIELRNDKDQPTCSMFYTAFTLDGADPSTRPVTFVYNGGPGSATLWLRMGSFGPKRVALVNGAPTGPPPYQLVDNQYTLLDKTDLVFIDMPGSGFSRINGKGTPKDFFGADQDVLAFDQFISRYISTFDRWNSPKVIFGESYGTPRSAMLAKRLQQDGIYVNGVVLLSSILNYGLYADAYPPVESLGDDWAYPLYLPTEAATAWYHHRLPNPPGSLDQLLPQVERFAQGDYLNALEQGARLSPSARDRIVSTLHQYTGISEAYIRASNLRVPYERFMTELMRGSDQMIGRYDGRYLDYMLDGNSETGRQDPTDSAIDGAFISGNNQLIRNFMGYDTTMQYRSTIYPTIRAAGGWDMKHLGQTPLNTAPDLAEAMVANSQMKVFSANGYYDFATPFFNTMYVLNHLNLNPQLQSNISYGFYPSGHMVYLNVDALALFHNDLENWYATLPRMH
ncbi:MAG TPA: peptidase S10 [Verrucomicrobiae bacterium]|jgi:carboxypeptidase C (cathepsin A)|nr:peptidase S10 [Verrucomicrobiae bacterium]